MGIALPPGEERHPMSHVPPADVVTALVNAGAAKAILPMRHLLIRGVLAGAILGFATTVAITATLQTGVPLVGALVFPVGLVMIVLLGLDLLTGSFALVPMAVLSGRARMSDMLMHFLGVLVGNLIGAVLYGAMMTLTLQGPGGAALGERLVAIAQAKTTGYAALGTMGMAAVFIKGVLCNWMVTLGVVLGMSSTTTAGKVAAVWLPIFIFFALGYEHTIVNFFIIPTGMMLGAKVTVMDWLLWNGLPVLVGNFIGGFLFTGLALKLTFGQAAPAAPAPASAPGPLQQPAIGLERTGVSV
jgi:formate/nitrite transporter